MARWQIISPHYLNVTGSQKSEWQYTEVDRTNGRKKTKNFPVPTLLDPDDPSMWTEVRGRDDGRILVSDGNNPGDSDIIFVGEPTPDMIPIDDDAKKVSASFAKKWVHPIEGLEGSYGDHLIQQFQTELAKVQSTPATTKIEGLDAMLMAITETMKQNQQILATLVQPKPEAARRA